MKNQYKSSSIEFLIQMNICQLKSIEIDKIWNNCKRPIIQMIKS